MQDGLTLYVIRHGETDWNAERRYQGQADIPLNDTGRAQAKRNGETLATLHLDPSRLDFVASPLDRARETMHIVRAALGLPLSDYRVDPALMELSYGHWQGVLQQDLPDVDPEGLKARNADPLHWRPRGGESYADLLQRTKSWLENITGDTVIAAHGGTARTLQALILDLEPTRVPTLAAPQDKVLGLQRETRTWL